MVTVTVQNPSFVKESMSFMDEREMFDRYLSLMNDVDFRQEDDLDEETVAQITKNYNTEVLYTNI